MSNIQNMTINMQIYMQTKILFNKLLKRCHWKSTPAISSGLAFTDANEYNNKMKLCRILK